MSWDSKEGSSAPLGATWIAVEQAYNFALYSENAERVTLLLYTAKNLANPALSYRFDQFRNKTGPVWHARIHKRDIADAEFYGYSVAGPSPGGTSPNHAFQPEKILLDPYAREVFFPASYDRGAAIGPGSNAGKAPLGVLCHHKMSFDWGHEKRPRHDSDLIIYEVHVRGFTMNPNSAVSRAHRGTFSGIVDKISYLRELGITAVELMPVFQFDDTEPNYWGYMPLNSFAPHRKYTSEQEGKCEPIREFQTMVKALHEADIEVILDVVYNHTGEGNERGPTFSFKGIDNSIYYISSDDAGHPYADYTGTGNTLACANRAVRQLIVDSLRYWVREMHVDGFRFDLASVFSRNKDGSINFDDPPIFSDIAADPYLSQVRLIAEPWEGNPAQPNYELGIFEPASAGNPCCDMPASRCPMSTNALHGSFPGIGWRQWNDRFRSTVRHFVKSDPGFVSDLMTRIYGSSDVFPDSVREAYRPYQSLNYVSAHDGLTLYDLVSYNSLDSWNSGNRDGEKGTSADVMALRKRQVKNFVCLLMLSNGTPMFRSGDEFLQTQNGDPNPYNVDGLTTWLDWSRLDTHPDMFRFFQKMIAFRKQHPSIARPVFWRDDVKWYGVSEGVDWSYESHSLAYCLRGTSLNDSDLYVMLNAYWELLTFTIQEGEAKEWKRIVDTCLPGPDDFVEPETASRLSSLDHVVQPRSMVVLIRR